MNHDLIPLMSVGFKPKLASFENNYFLQLWLDSPHKDKIVIGQHSLMCNNETQQLRYTDAWTGKYDGVHMYNGQLTYTESILNILISSYFVHLYSLNTF